MSTNGLPGDYGPPQQGDQGYSTRLGQYGGGAGSPLDGIPRPPYQHGSYPPYPDGWDAGPRGNIVNAGSNGGPTSRVNGAAVPNGVLPVVYGRGRVEGTIFHYVRSGNGGVFYVWICGGPIHSVVKAYNAGVEAPGTWSFEYSLGPEVPASTPAYVWTFTQRFPFVCWAIITVPEDNTTDSIGPFSFEVKGKLLYDPRENRILNANNFSGAAGWQGSFDDPTITTGQADPFGGTAATLLEFAGAGDHNWFTGATVVAPGDYVNAAIWLKGASGEPPLLVTWEAYNTGPPLEATTINVAVTADRWIGPIDATQLCTVAGISAAGIYITGVTAPKLIVYGAHIALKAYFGGRSITTGTAIVPVTAWSRNLPLVLLDILTGGPTANPHSARVPFLPANILLSSFGNAASIAGRDEGGGDIRWGVDVVFNQAGQGVDQALARARAVAPCDIYRQDDLWRCDIEHEAGDAELEFDTETNTYPADLAWEIPARQDRPARVRLSFADPDKQWVADSAIYPPPDETITELDETSLSLDASASRRQMVQFAAYMFRVGKMKRFQLRGTPIAALAHRYQRVAVTSEVSAISRRECVVIGLGMNEGGLEWTAQLRETDPSLFTAVDPGTPGSGGTPGVDPTVPPVVQPRFDDPATFLMGVSPARNYEARTLYPAASWAQSDVTGWDADKIDDGILTVAAGDFTAAADTTIRLDAGSAIDFCAARIALAVDSIPAGWLFEMSPDDAAWAPVANTFKRPTDEATAGLWGEWDLPTAARYIRLRKGSAVAGTEIIRELQFFDYKGLYVNSAFVRVEDAAGNKLGQFTATFARQTVDMTPYAITSIAPNGTIIKTVDVWLVNVSVKGNSSIRVRVTQVITAVPLDEPQKPRMLRVDHLTGIARWQRPIYYKDGATYGGSMWAATNTSVFDADKVNDGITNVVAVNPNAAGVTDITLDLGATGKAFAAFVITFTTPTAIIGFIDQFVVQYWNGSAWVSLPTYFATFGTAVTYTKFSQVATFPSYDLYVPTANGVYVEVDWRDLTPAAPLKWRLHQITAVAIDIPIGEIQPLEFERWNLVAGFEVWAGLFGITNGAPMNLLGKSPGSVAAGGPANTEFQITSSLFDAGPFAASGVRRRSGYPGIFKDSLGVTQGAGVVGSENTLGYLYEVTVKSVAADLVTESVARFAWDYLRSKVVGVSL